MKTDKNKTGWEGVTLEKSITEDDGYVSQTYTAKVSVKGKNRVIGWFNTPEQAGRAYDFAMEYFKQHKKIPSRELVYKDRDAHKEK